MSSSLDTHSIQGSARTSCSCCRSSSWISSVYSHWTDHPQWTIVWRCHGSISSGYAEPWSVSFFVLRSTSSIIAWFRSPEDYEMLLRLDERVQRKTVNKSVFDSLLTVNVNETYLNDQCTICMENYVMGQSMKRLPCSHMFHCNCIETYLKNFSTQCPLDNLPIAWLFICCFLCYFFYRLNRWDLSHVLSTKIFDML